MYTIIWPVLSLLIVLTALKYAGRSLMRKHTKRQEKFNLEFDALIGSNSADKN